MRNALRLVLGLVLSLGTMAETGPLSSLTDLLWTHRVILVGGASQQTLSELENRSGEIDERDLIWFCLVSGEVRTNYGGALADGFFTHLRESYFDTEGGPVLLIGKDGGVKSRDQELDIDAYFDRIDGMPMRRAEMRSRLDGQ